MRSDYISAFDALLGIRYLSDDPDRAEGRIEFRDELTQPFGLVHGGVISALVESVCSRATGVAVREDGMAAMGQSLEISFLRPIAAGSVAVSARARHRGRTTWVWEAEATDDDGRLCALAKMTIAIRPGSPSKP